MARKWLLAAVLMLAGVPAQAQQAEGYWTGVLEPTAATTIRIGVTIQRREDGALTGSLDSPDQNAFAIPLAGVETQGESLAFTVPPVSASWLGRWNAATACWDGQFVQAGQSLALVLCAADGGTRPVPPALPADWQLPDDIAITALLERRIAGRPGAMIVAGVLEANGSRQIVALGSASSRPADGNTMFEIGSITKVFTALLLAQMSLSGEVALDDPVERYLPDGTDLPPGSDGAMTLRHLSHHNSGLPRLPGNMPFGDPADPYADYSEALLLAYLGGYQPARPPGQAFEYSNLGVGLLGYALGRAGGRPYGELLQRRVLEPLGLDDTAITLSPAQEARFARGHDEFMRPTPPWQMGALPGAGALRSSASDMLDFLAALLARPAGPLAEEFALTAAIRAGGDGGPLRGLGWLIAEFPSGVTLHHGGGTGGYRSHIAVQPDTRRAVVVLTDSAVEPGAGDLALHLIAGAPVAAEVPVPEAPPSVARQDEVVLTPAQLGHVTGRYRLAPGVDMAVVRSGAGLTAQITGQPAFPIFPSGPLEFFWRVVAARIVFAETDGRITGAVLHQNGREIPLEPMQQGEN